MCIVWHLMYSCTETQEQAAKSVLSRSYGTLHWMQQSHDHLVLELDGGVAKYLQSNSFDHVITEEILCMHGDKVRYPTAEIGPMILNHQ